MKKIYLNCFAFTLIIFIVASCSKGENAIAPANIKGYVIKYYTEEAMKLDAYYIKKTVYTEYKKDGTYKDTLNGKVTNLGSYTYSRSKYNIGTIIESYSDTSNQRGLDNFQTILTFTDPSNGTYYSDFDIDSRSRESGTFEIISRGENNI